MNFGLNRLLHDDSAAVRAADYDCGGGGGGEREHMFDKVVTPSDVGKLNRLVIPKQHAERFFPLDSSTNEKGLLLNFEDRNGKSWRFRYSYWNSSQSYVMTKGWSRFVKEKRLDAGDIVSFQRGIGEIGRDRLYIDWRRRPDFPVVVDHLHHHHHRHIPHAAAVLRPSGVVPTAWSSLVWPPFAAAAGYPAATAPRDYQFNSGSSNSNNSKIFDWRSEGCCSYGSGVVYLRSSDGRGVATVAEGNAPMQQEQDYGGGGGADVVGGNHEALLQSSSEETVPVMKRSRLRLFGVNMEYCSISSSDESDLLFSTTSNQNPTSKDH